MSIDALVCGRLHRAPQSRTSSNGQQYAVCTVRVTDKDSAPQFISVITSVRHVSE